MRNMILMEAVDKTFNPAPYVSALKKLLNTCKLTKFRSAESNLNFYSAFFCCQAEDPLTFDQWRQIYTAALNDSAFCNSLVLYMALYQPKTYEGLFRPLGQLVDSELREMRTNQIRYLSDVKAFYLMMQNRFESIGITIKAQTNDMGAIQFLVTVNGVLQTFIFYLNDLIQRQMDGSYDKDDITFEVHGEPLAEDVRSLLTMLESAEDWIANETDHIIKTELRPMNEGIVNAAKEKAKELHVAQQKAERHFDEAIMAKVKDIRQKRRNAKHAEMVGEALRVNRELKRIMRTLPIALISKELAVITWVISVVIDRKTDKKDREILVNQIKDELEIVEEKIAVAERNGDDKGKVELIRLRQKLRREYERIQKYRYDPNNMPS